MVNHVRGNVLQRLSVSSGICQSILTHERLPCYHIDSDSDMGFGGPPLVIRTRIFEKEMGLKSFTSCLTLIRQIVDLCHIISTCFW